MTQRLGIEQPLTEDQRQLIVEHADWARSIAKGLIGGSSTLQADPELAVAEALWGLVRAARKYTPVEGAQFRTYAHSAVKGQVLEILRAPDRVMPHVPVVEDRPETDEEPSAGAAAWMIAGRATNPEERAISRQLVTLVCQVSEQLDPIAQQVLRGVYRDDEDQVALGERLGLKPYQVSRVLQRAEDELREGCRAAGILR